MALADREVVPMSVVRAWAIKHGHEVGKRGHLPQAVIDDFNRRSTNRVAVNRNPMRVKVLQFEQEAVSA